ncbi:EAL domain-containing protein [Rubrobacter marinus]|uniref:EAL domain-containing protein n=1 Tax=Rubrobacter marinus TaxID=2653852 RepID=A0A6G8PU89_9ACTN|nr:EAL domain-containing protein [Rubrobacter marinus]QIN77662.1 EAL domain-containing protein [Rubrobacter marinus]
MRTRAPGVAWRAFLALGLVALVVCALLPAGSARLVVSLVLAVAAAGAIGLGSRSNAPAYARPWYAILAAQALFVAGDAVRGGREVLDVAVGASPYLADVPALAGRVALVVALALLVRERARGRGSLVLADAAIAAVWLGVLAWLFLVEPYAPGGPASPIERLVPILYPLVGALGLAFAGSLVLGRGPRSLPLYLVGAASAVFAVCDTLYAASALAGTFYAGHPATYGWLAAYALLGAAALHPSMAERGGTRGGAPIRFTRRRVAPVAAATLFAPAILVVQYLRGEPAHLPVVVVGSIALFALVLVRLDGLVRAASFVREKLDRTLGREEVLARSAATLVAATDRRGIYDAALEAARALTEGASELGGVRIALGNVDEMVVVAATGPEAEGSEGNKILSRDLPLAARGALLQRRSISVERSASPWLSGRSRADAPAGEYYFVPLATHERMRGVILSSTGSALEEGVRRGLDSLATQVAYALERTDLTEDLHRRRSEERFESLVQNASDAIAILEADGGIRYVSPSYEQVLGLKPESVAGKRVFDLVHPDDAERARAFFERVVASPGVSPSLELRMRRADGAYRHVELIANNLLSDPNVQGVVANSRDITKRKEAEEKLAYRAFHDGLTDLPNRALLMDRLDHALTGRTARRDSVAVLFFDLDRFKVLNDSLGHEAGDALLVEVGKRLKASLRPEDTVARLGGDEFVVLLEDVEGMGQVVYVAERVIKLFEAPFVLEGREVYISASIGISIGGPGGDSPTDLLRNADIAMYRAKSNGAASYEIFDAAMGAQALLQLEKQTDVRRAVERREFVVFYQPKVELSSGALHGFEALVRWAHPERGIVSPGEFIPLAEESDLIVRIGRFVLEESCRQAKVWRDRYGAHAPAVGVNLSARQFRDPNLARIVGAALEETGLDPNALLLEVTESAMMDDAESSGARLRELKALGVRIAIDDFGTGYSSLAYLQHFPLDMLKIDRSFVTELGRDPKGTAIIEAVSSLGHLLEMQVLAEGVETTDQLARLRDLGCELGQGYYWSRPLPQEEAEELIAKSFGTANGG